jgi:hypothetical protein
VPSATARVSFHFAALAAGAAPRGYPFGADEDGLEAPARHVAAQLAGLPRGARGSLLGVLRERSVRLPWTALHPDWIESLLAGLPPRWRDWALTCLSPSQRTVGGSGEGRGAAPPRWWVEWFEADARRRLGYPELPPWDRAAGPPGSLWERDHRDVVRLLARHGTRGFVSAVRRLPREEAQRWLWQLPEACQPEASAVARARAWSEDPFWPEAFRALEGDAPGAEARVFRLALADWARAGVEGGQEPQLRRLAFRLPRAWGEWLLAQLERRPGWLSRPLAGGLEAWRRSLDALEEAPA